MKGDKKEKSAFSSSSFDSSFDNAITETGRDAETATVMGQSVTVQTTNKAKILQPCRGMYEAVGDGERSRPRVRNVYGEHGGGCGPAPRPLCPK